MKLPMNILGSTAAQFALAGLILAASIYIVVRQRAAGKAPALAAPDAVTAVTGPQVFTRKGERLEVPERKDPEAESRLDRVLAPFRSAPKIPAVSALPISAMDVAPPSVPHPETAFVPFGRLIPCETVIAIESNRLDTPVIGLVTEDVWTAGKIVVPKGAEVHGRAALDRMRERLAASGAWTIVWRDQSERNGSEVTVQGLALDRDREADEWGKRDGSAGLRGEIVRTTDDRELQLFASTFLATATSALQSTTGAGLLGAVNVPAATVRNGTLAGTSAILREYADRMRAAIASDGFYLRIPAGKAFYLYVTQPIGAPRPGELSSSHEK